MRREDMIRIFEDTMLLCDTNEILMNKINYQKELDKIIEQTRTLSNKKLIYSIIIGIE